MNSPGENEAEVPEKTSDSARQKDSSRIDSAGKLVGLVCSILFLSWAIFYIHSGRAGVANPAEGSAYYALLILFSGPIIFFWVNAGTDRATIDTPLGKFLISGAYAVAIAIVVIVHLLSHETWCVCTFRFSKAPGEVLRLEYLGNGQFWPLEKMGGVSVRFGGLDLKESVIVTYRTPISVHSKEVVLHRSKSVMQSINLDSLPDL